MNKKIYFFIAILLASTVFGNAFGMRRRRKNHTYKPKMSQQELAQQIKRYKELQEATIKPRTQSQNDIRSKSLIAANRRLKNTQRRRKRVTSKPRPTRRPAKRVAPKSRRPTPKKVNPRKNQRTRRREMEPRQQATNDNFIKTLYELGFAQAHADLTSGSHIVQIKAASQSQGPTCGVAALRNSMLVINYFLIGDIKYLKLLKNQKDMNTYTQKVITSQLPNQNIHSTCIEGMLESNAFNVLPPAYKKSNNILITVNTKNTTVVDNPALIHLLNSVKTAIAKIKDFENGDYHSFIVRSGGTENKNTGKRTNFKKLVKSGGHWVSISVIKKDNKLYWFIVNSGRASIINIAKEFISHI